MSETRARIRRAAGGLVVALAAMCLLPTSAVAQINVLTVDCTPFVSPNPMTSFGPDNTMGMSLQQVDPGGVLFNVTEVIPAVFRGLTAAQLGAYDLIAINNNPSRIDCGSGLGLGTTWHSVIGVPSGGRIVLSSHDAARFKIIIPPGGAFFGVGTPGPGVEPFGADEIVRDAALWAGGGTRTGLLIFNDSARFGTVGGSGWANPELNLPVAWSITDSDQTQGNPHDGGYTQIVPAFTAHPIYVNVTDTRFGLDSISSFAANIGDGSFHSIFGSYNPAIFIPTEVVINAGVVDVGGFNAANPGIGAGNTIPGPDGSAITLIRNEDMPPEVECVETVNPSGKNVPRAGQRSPGQNEDGFYQLAAFDDFDPDPQIFVSDLNGSGPFGPFSSGANVKITEAPGGTATSKPMGSPKTGGIAAHVTLTGDAVVTAVDAAGNTASTTCLVPPPPK